VIKSELVCCISFETYFWHGFSAGPNNSSFVKEKLFVSHDRRSNDHIMWPFWFVAVLMDETLDGLRSNSIVVQCLLPTRPVILYFI